MLPSPGYQGFRTAPIPSGWVQRRLSAVAPRLQTPLRPFRAHLRNGSVPRRAPAGGGAGFLIDAVIPPNQPWSMTRTEVRGSLRPPAASCRGGRCWFVARLGNLPMFPAVSASRAPATVPPPQSSRRNGAARQERLPITAIENRTCIPIDDVLLRQRMTSMGISTTGLSTLMRCPKSTIQRWVKPGSVVPWRGVQQMATVVGGGAGAPGGEAESI
jgi:hypothetical protein